MIKHALFVALIVFLGSIFLRLILGNVPITATWLQDITVYKK